MAGKSLPKDANGRYLDGRQSEGSVRLGYVSPAMHKRMMAYAKAFGISRQELVIRAIDNFLLNWEEAIEDSELSQVTAIEDL